MKRLALILGGVTVVVLIAVNVVAYQQAVDLVTRTDDERNIYSETPTNYRMSDYEAIELVAADGIETVAWYVPGSTDAGVIMVHGIGGDRSTMLDEMAMLNDLGLHLLALDLRAHGRSEGDLITFGYYEAWDVEAAADYLRDEIGLRQVGVYGESMGGATALFAAANDAELEPIVAHTPFASMEDTIDTSVRFFTGLPPFPFADLIQFYAETRYAEGLGAEDIAPIETVERIAPRPVLLMVAGSDDVVSPEGWIDQSEQLGPHVTLWYEAEAEHAAFNAAPYAAQFEERVSAFFAAHLLSD